MCNSFLKKKNQVTLEDLFFIKKAKDKEGKIVETKRWFPLNISNISAYSSEEKTFSKLGYRYEKGDNGELTKVRFFKKSGELF